MSTLHEVAQIICAQERIAAELAFPIRAVVKDGQEGFAIHALNAHSRAWQPVGLFQTSYAEAIRERDQLLDLLDESALGRPAESAVRFSADADFARAVSRAQP
jgi:hypothetical protein